MKAAATHEGAVAKGSVHLSRAASQWGSQPLRVQALGGKDTTAATVFKPPGRRRSQHCRMMLTAAIKENDLEALRSAVAYAAAGSNRYHVESRLVDMASSRIQALHMSRLRAARAQGDIPAMAAAVEEV